jgi:hypothetical protein
MIAVLMPVIAGALLSRSGENETHQTEKYVLRE